MAHIGIRLQSITKSGKLKAEGRTADLAFDLITFADAMVNARTSAILLEGTAKEVAKIITHRVSVPVIGCGSGPDCDSRIFIVPNILSLSHRSVPKFPKRYGDLKSATIQSITAYTQEVHLRYFPDDRHSYHIKSGQFEKLQQMLQTSAL